MGLKLNSEDARSADKFSTIIRETGAYVGVITRAEKLISEKGTEGVGFSFRADDGSSAAYLDVYTTRPTGESLRGAKLVSAILAVLRLREVKEGDITFDRWDNDVRKMMPATATGYPELMGKRIGFVLQKELWTNSRGRDLERMNLVTAFCADTRMTAAEVLDRKTSAERLDGIVKNLAPFRDSRKSVTLQATSDVDDEIPF